MQTISCPDCSDIVLMWPDDEPLDMEELERKVIAHEKKKADLEALLDN